MVVLGCEVGTGVVARGRETPSLGLLLSWRVGGLPWWLTGAPPWPQTPVQTWGPRRKDRGARQLPRRQRNHLDLKESKET